MVNRDDLRGEYNPFIINEIISNPSLILDTINHGCTKGFQ